MRMHCKINLLDFFLLLAPVPVPVEVQLHLHLWKVVTRDDGSRASLDMFMLSVESGRAGRLFYIQRGNEAGTEGSSLADNRDKPFSMICQIFWKIVLCRVVS